MTEQKKRKRPLGEQVIRAISSGKVDAWLEGIIQASVQRSKYLRDKKALQLVLSLEEGDTVKVTKGIKPAYLVGRVGTVQDVDRKMRRGVPMVSVDFQFPMRRYGRVIVMPASCLQKVEEQESFEGVTTL